MYIVTYTHKRIVTNEMTLIAKIEFGVWQFAYYKDT
jgi:hypothetical protein